MMINQPEKLPENTHDDQSAVSEKDDPEDRGS